MRYFHGSLNHMNIGETLTGRGTDYFQEWKNSDAFLILESLRPENFIPHTCAVFAVGNTDDILVSGGGTEFVFELKPSKNTSITRHDVNWSSFMSILINEGHNFDSKEVQGAAKNYWNGVPYPLGKSTWEYLMVDAKIIDVKPYRGFSCNPETQDHAWQNRVDFYLPKPSSSSKILSL